jgi:MarR family 2-MHQ and catechol resistance regulon transcriptional repressor
MLSAHPEGEDGLPPPGRRSIATAGAVSTRRPRGAETEQAMSNGATASPRPAPAASAPANGQNQAQPERAQPAVHPKWLTFATAEAEPAHDPDDVARFTAFRQLLKTAGALDRAATDVLADLNLTAGAFSALLELGDAHPTGLAPSELARRLAVARRTATLYVDILARHGWVARRAHPDDRRMVLASLTPDGERLLDDLGPAYKRRLAALLGDLTPLQAERLRQLLALVGTAGEPGDEPSP